MKGRGKQAVAAVRSQSQETLHPNHRLKQERFVDISQFGLPRALTLESGGDNDDLLRKMQSAASFFKGKRKKGKTGEGGDW